MAVALTPKSSSTSRMSKVHGSGMGTSTPASHSGGARSSRRKQRCWIFRVSGITRDVKESDLLSSVRERYTTVKRLVITPVSKAGVNRATDTRSADVLVEVQFTGPQPSEGPGALLCDLLCGVSVDAQPVELPRGRKKRQRVDAASSEASDSDIRGIGRGPASRTKIMVALGVELQLDPRFERLEKAEVDDHEIGAIYGLGEAGASGWARLNVLGCNLDANVEPDSRSPAALTRSITRDAEDGLRKQTGTGGGGLHNVEEDEDEEDSAGGGRCITAKSVVGHGSSPVYASANSDDPNNVRRLSRRNSGGTVAPSADLGPMPTVTLFSGKSQPAREAHDSSEARSTQVSRTQQQQVPAFPGQDQKSQATQQQRRSQVHVNSTQNQEAQQQPERCEAPPHARPQAQQQHRGSGQQWDDVVGRVTTTPGPGTHSLDMGSMDLPISLDHAVKTELDALLPTNADSSTTPWSGSDSDHAGGLLDPTCPVQRGNDGVPRWACPFDASGVTEADFASGSMVMDFGDVNDLFPSSDGSTVGTATPAPSVSGSNADAGAGERPCQEVTSGARWVPEKPPQDKVIVEPSRKDCDFEGRPATPTAPVMNSRSSGNLMGAPNQCHLIITGLDRTGIDPRNLNVTVHFGIDSVHKMGKAAGPIQVGAGGRMYAPVFYPSMQEIWPALYSTNNIRVVEVDVVVEIRSEAGDYQYVAPHLKVTYHRSPFFGEDMERRSQGGGGRRSVNPSSTAGNAISPDETPNISYSCVDYSCGDWFAEMCQSVFRTGTSHQPLHEDPHDLMSVDT